MDPELKMAFEALTKDASIWDDSGDTLEAARTSIDGVVVPRGAFSFAGIEIAEEYFLLHSMVVRLLATGVAETRAGAGALRAVRDEFEGFEDITQADLYALWQPVE